MFHLPALQQVSPFLQQYFLTPIGLIALLALIPLILFYLMRPDPEERMMPSMQFFMEEERSGRMQNAIRMLQRNLVLLLHVLFIGLLAAALAGPY
ncbi:MAG: BatA domain-containing protein, partial [Candidatus Nanohaloarchaea archaeon]|nr:BatA domain-containing protein [Candidatus Nanohaloarchaea archaeon]